MNDLVFFVVQALEFLKTNWKKETKYTQQAVADKLGVANSYISKARGGNVNFAAKLKPKLLKLIEDELKIGSFSETKQVFISKDGEEYDVVVDIDNYKLEKMDGVKLIRMLRNTKRLDISTTWLGEVYGDITDYLKKYPGILKGKNIRLLLLHPDSYGTLLRSKSLSADIETGFNRIKEDLYNLHKILSDYDEKPKMEVRLYHSLPSVNLIVTDKFIVGGFYTHQKKSRDIEQIIIDRTKGSEFGKTLEENFLEVWQLSKGSIIEIDNIQAVADKFIAPPYKRYNLAHYKKLVGVYKVFFPEKYSSHHDFRDNKIATSIGCNILEIKINEHDDLVCNMKALTVSSHDEEDSIQIYEGELVSTKFNNPKYAILNFTNQTKTRYFSILISIPQKEDEDKFFGIFSIIYRSSDRIGSGLIVLNKLSVEDKSYDELKPKIVYPAKDNNLSSAFIRYLINRKESLITSIPSKALRYIIDEFNLTGTYNLYAPNRSERTITKGILIMFETGLVRYKNQRSGYHGIGWATIDEKAGRGKEQVNLYINISNSNPDINRSAFFILKISRNDENAQNKNKKSSDKRTYYGISVTPTWKEAFPMGAKIIMEKESDTAKDDDFIDKKPEKILVDSSKYKKLPDKIKNLIGTSSNLISFSDKPNSGEINYKEVFYKAACFDDSNNEDSSCQKNLEHAVSHGITEEEAKLINGNKDILRKLKKHIEKVSEL